MIKNPNYQFYIYERKHDDGSVNVRITAVSSFAGKPVEGHADCHPGDEFDIEYGMALAASRCNEKIAAKRCHRAYSKVDEAKAQVNAAMAHLQKMMQYEADAEANYNMASYELAQVLAYKYAGQTCDCGCDCDCGENCECGCHN